MDRAGKEQLVQGVADKVNQSTAFFLTEYRGMKVSEMTLLRQELRKVESDLQVIKNRLIKRAIDGNSIAGLEEHLKGPTAVAFVKEDAVGAAKVLTKYADEFEPFTLRAGVLRGELIGLDQIKALSKLPSKEELYAKLLATLLAPVTNVVRALNAVPTKVVQVLAAIKDTKE